MALFSSQSIGPTQSPVPTALRALPGAFLTGLSAGVLILLSVCYWGRFDQCTAVTVYPAWFWCTIGLMLSLIVARCGRRRSGAVLAVLWIVFLVTFEDSPWSLVRGILPQGTFPDRLRVITFNCASDADAAREVIAHDPDIVLFQETVSLAILAGVAQELYGDRGRVYWSPDASVITRLELEVVEVAPQHRENYVHVRVKLDAGGWVDVVSLRLFPSPLRMDLWNPRCWRVYAKNRRQRRRQLATIAGQLDTIPANQPVIVGGDFNAVPGDAVFRLLRPRFQDAFETAGRGWGRSFMSGLPILRIDQLWCSGEWTPMQVFAVQSTHSDHAMVVGDFVFQRD